MSARLSENEKNYMSMHQVEIEAKIRSIFAEMDALVFRIPGVHVSGGLLQLPSHK